MVAQILLLFCLVSPLFLLRAPIWSAFLRFPSSDRPRSKKATTRSQTRATIRASPINAGAQETTESHDQEQHDRLAARKRQRAHEAELRRAFAASVIAANVKGNADRKKFKAELDAARRQAANAPPPGDTIGGATPTPAISRFNPVKPRPSSWSCGTTVLAKYSAESKSWKKAMVVSQDGSDVTVRFDGYTDDTVIPAARIKAFDASAAPRKRAAPPKRAPLQPATQLPRATSPSDKVVASARACLSKLSPTNFDKLAATIVELEIDGPATLTALVGLMFERAISEPAFCSIYARLFAKCAKELPPVADGEGDGKELTFRTLLLRRAQSEFEMGGLDGEAAATAAERQRKLGSAIFVGQLWLEGLLREAIVHGCMRQVLDAADNAPSALHTDAVEIACTLVRVIGPACDASGGRGRASINEYIARMRTWASDKVRLPAARLRFKVMDVIDDRGQGWKHKA